MGTRREISGNDILLSIDPDGGTNYKLLVCLTSNSLERTTNVIDAASKCGPNKLPGVQDIKVPFTFYDVLDADAGEVSEDALHPLWANKTTISWKYGPAIPASGDVTYTGIGFIGSLNKADAQNSPSTITGTIEVKGTITQTITGS
jgi:hypothetical protein